VVYWVCGNAASALALLDSWEFGGHCAPIDALRFRDRSKMNKFRQEICFTLLESKVCNRVRGQTEEHLQLVIARFRLEI